MRSASASDMSGRDRILAAAMRRFAVDGFDGATVRAIAAEADVSPALVLHHFGSKRGLRAACDENVRTTIREGKEQALAGGGNVDALQAMRLADDTMPVMRYLARVLVAGGEEAATLFDEILADAEIYTQQAIDDGLMRPTDDLHTTVTILTAWSLGALALHEHVTRHTGADLTGDLNKLAGWMVPVSRILAEGIMTDRGKAFMDDVAATLAPDDQRDTAPTIDPANLNDPSDPTSPDPPSSAAR